MTADELAQGDVADPHPTRISEELTAQNSQEITTAAEMTKTERVEEDGLLRRQQLSLIRGNLGRRPVSIIGANFRGPRRRFETRFWPWGSA